MAAGSGSGSGSGLGFGFGFSLGLPHSSFARFSSPSASSSASRERSTASTDIPRLLAHVQGKAQAHLSSAIASERARRWGEAIDHYRKLLRSLMRTQLPDSYIPGPDYTQLLLETYYHIGVAFQKLDRHQKALEEFTNAIEISHIPKALHLKYFLPVLAYFQGWMEADVLQALLLAEEGETLDQCFPNCGSGTIRWVASQFQYACQVGCVSKSFYHTPVYARRAYANVKCGKMKEAMYDANRAVTLDTSNPDVYCIRALVWSSARENRRALVDLNHSMKLNPSHVCTLILRGTILEFLGATSSDRNKDHEKAFKLCQDSRQFFDVLTFHSPKMPAFFDRFLWSLNAFHTIMVINLFEGAMFAFQGDYRKRTSSRESSRQMSYSSYSEDTASISKLRGPFKCGSVATYPDNTALLRRKVYSKLLMDSNIGVNEKIEQRKKSNASVSSRSGYIQEKSSQNASENPMAALYGMDDSKSSKGSIRQF